MNRLVPGHSLAVFRIFFGVLLFVHIFVKWINGVVDDVYISPKILFPFIGFEWLPRLTSSEFYWLHAVLGLASLLIAAGFIFRLALVFFFFGFLYLFLIEEPYYQNHYYLILLFTMLLFVSSAGRVLSIDGLWRRSKDWLVPASDYWLLRFQMATVYFFAGVAKLNVDWLRGRPLDQWLQGTWLEGHALVISYAGLFFDLLIVPLLLWRPMRNVAVLLAVVFHVTNHFLFHIGIFPFLAMAATLLFLDYDWPTHSAPQMKSRNVPKATKLFICVWCFVQVVLPLRHWLYPGPVAWTLEGFQFSWMMRLNNRVGSGEFRVETDKGVEIVFPENELTAFQAQIVRSDPNEILKFARYLRRIYEERGQNVNRVTANLHLNLNSHGVRPFVDPEEDLSRAPYGLLIHNRWILPPN